MSTKLSGTFFSAYLIVDDSMKHFRSVVLYLIWRPIRTKGIFTWPVDRHLVSVAAGMDSNSAAFSVVTSLSVSNDISELLIMHTPFY